MAMNLNTNYLLWELAGASINFSAFNGEDCGYDEDDYYGDKYGEGDIYGYGDGKVYGLGVGYTIGNGCDYGYYV